MSKSKNILLLKTMTVFYPLHFLTCAHRYSLQNGGFGDVVSGMGDNKPFLLLYKHVKGNKGSLICVFISVIWITGSLCLGPGLYYVNYIYQ